MFAFWLCTLQEDIRRLNPSADLGELVTGLKLRVLDADHPSSEIPDEALNNAVGSIHVVEAGDTMWAITRR